MELQGDLLAVMQEKYTQHIQQMGDQLRQLEVEKTDQFKKTAPADAVARNRIEEQFKKRQHDLEAKLKEFQGKEARQKEMEKEVVKQKNHVKKLESEISTT